MLWNDVEHFRLTRNMRLDAAAPDYQRFAQYLLDVGDGKIPIVEKPDFIEIPTWLQSRGIQSGKVSDLIDEVFPDLEKKFHALDANLDYFVERAILTPTNRVMDDLNILIMNRLRLSLTNP